VRNAGRTVAREELQKTIWGDGTFVDFDRGLNFCIAQIRSALGDDAANPLYVKTIARQGYQFIAPIEQLAPAEAAPPQRTRSLRRVAFPVAAALAVAAVALSVTIVVHGHVPTKPVPVIAVVRFDNETGDPALTRFSDALTDTFVERLTADSDDRYAVIGNAKILRAPRSERDLLAISRSLRATFIILGQVQASGAKTRILAHLIHMPEQTHVSVARLERTLEDPLAVEGDAAAKIAARFSRKLQSLPPDRLR
jgi:TolB-like protein